MKCVLSSIVLLATLDQLIWKMKGLTCFMASMHLCIASFVLNGRRFEEFNGVCLFCKKLDFFEIHSHFSPCSHSYTYVSVATGNVEKGTGAGRERERESGEMLSVSKNSAHVARYCT